MDLTKLERRTRRTRMLTWPMAYITNQLVAATTGLNADGTYRWLVRFRNPFLNFLFWLPTTIISDECEPARGPLLIRWHLLRLWGGRAVMLHCFLRADNSRHFHDHPWAFRTLLLTPYREHVPFETILGMAGRPYLAEGFSPSGIRDARGRMGYVKEHRRFSLLRRAASWLHWVETIKPLTWTLVYHGPSERVWGFNTEQGWLSFGDEYRKHFPCE